MSPGRPSSARDGQHFAQMFVHHADGGRALTNGGGNALDRAMPYVAGREYAGQARLERQRLAMVRPLRSRQLEKVTTRDDVTLWVASDLVGEPMVVWDAADHDEQGIGGLDVLAALVPVVEMDVLHP